MPHQKGDFAPSDRDCMTERGGLPPQLASRGGRTAPLQTVTILSATKPAGKSIGIEKPARSCPTTLQSREGKVPVFVIRKREIPGKVCEQRGQSPRFGNRPRKQEAQSRKRKEPHAGEAPRISVANAVTSACSRNSRRRRPDPRRARRSRDTSDSMRLPGRRPPVRASLRSSCRTHRRGRWERRSSGR